MMILSFVKLVFFFAPLVALLALVCWVVYKGVKNPEFLNIDDKGDR